MMRSVLIALMLSMATSGSLSAQEWARKMFEVSNHDFGTVARGGKAEYSFTFTNLYQEDIHIASVRTSCGCTTPSVTKRTVKTWEKAAVIAKLNTSRFLGERSATLTVVIDKPFYAEVQLQVRGYIRGDLLLSPGGVDFGTHDGTKQASKQIRIQHAGSPAWRISAIKSPSPHITAEAVEVARNNKQVTYDLTVFLAEDAPEGYVNESLIIETNDRTSGRFPIEVQGRVVSTKLTVSPASLFLGVLQPGQKVTKQVVLKGRKPFKIVDVDCPGGCFQCKPSSAAKPLHLLPVTFTAGNKPGKVSETITIKTSLGGSTSLVAYAQIKPAETTEPPETEAPETVEPPKKEPVQKSVLAPYSDVVPPPPVSKTEGLRQLSPPAESNTSVKTPADSDAKPVADGPQSNEPAAAKEPPADPNAVVPPADATADDDEREPDVPLPSDAEVDATDDDAPPPAPKDLFR